MVGRIACCGTVAELSTGYQWVSSLPSSCGEQGGAPLSGGASMAAVRNPGSLRLSTQTLPRPDSESSQPGSCVKQGEASLSAGNSTAVVRNAGSSRQSGLSSTFPRVNSQSSTMSNVQMKIDLARANPPLTNSQASSKSHSSP